MIAHHAIKSDKFIRFYSFDVLADFLFAPEGLLSNDTVTEGEVGQLLKGYSNGHKEMYCLALDELYNANVFRIEVALYPSLYLHQRPSAARSRIRHLDVVVSAEFSSTQFAPTYFQSDIINIQSLPKLYPKLQTLSVTIVNEVEAESHTRPFADGFFAHKLAQATYRMTREIVYALRGLEAPGLREKRVRLEQGDADRLKSRHWGFKAVEINCMHRDDHELALEMVHLPFCVVKL